MRCGAALCVLAAALPAQTLISVRPAGGMPGQELEVNCYGTGLKDTVAVVWFEPGVDVLELVPERDDKVHLKLAVRADCALGTLPLLLQTRRGLTRAKAFRVGPLPSVGSEDGQAQRAESAQPIALDTTVDGRILPEETDWFAVELVEGQALRIEAEGVRLGLYDLDLQLELFAPDGRLLVRSDDTSLGRADPWLSWIAAEAGLHRFALRDVAFGGARVGLYRLHVGTFPRPVGVLPAGGRPGETLQVALLGDAVPATTTLTLPQQPGVHDVFPTVDGRPCPTPVHVVVDERANFVEGAEPAAAPAQPCAFHGVLAAPGEQDRFAFAAKKGERVELRALARTLRSPLDPVLRVHDDAGKELAVNDDGLGLDARLRFVAPADGTYRVAVVDHLGRGGADYFYRLEVGELAAGPTTREAVPGRRPEDLGVAVPRGGRGATVLQVSGVDARDGVTLDFAGLPPGVRVVPIALPQGSALVPVVFEAAADAELHAALATPLARAEKEPHERPLQHEHDYPMLRVQNNAPYEQHTARALPVAVADAMPFDVSVAQPTVPILQSGSLSLPVHAARVEGNKDTITVTALWLPPGVSASTVRLTGDTQDGAMSFSANGQAAVGRWPIVLVATIDVGGVSRASCTAPVLLEVQEPWLVAKLPRASVEQGAELVYEVELEPRRPFEGAITAELKRLPDGVAVTMPAIAADSTALPIRLAAAADARAGRHRSLYLRLSIETPDGVVAFVAGGGGELRVDEPLPPPAGAEAEGARR
ncbi:MAG: PPC domain-containing protein [Planctomycetes bacterium]|nr:PPC domain-containing protein [Planctomycetota bacterium]